MNAFFGDRRQNQNQPRQQSSTSENPVMEFLRGVTGRPAMDAATAAAAQFGDYVSENFQVPPQFMDHQQQPPPTGPPPASPAAMRQLPTISVSAEDLVEPSNRECCICFEENNIHDKVVRLPCAHIYHSECITDWLSRHCTCPTCRYELPTEDPRYEAGRRARMKSRKPRYAKYELERMGIRELKNLLPRRRSSSAMFSDKSDLIDYLVTNEIVDLISTPPPIEFPNLAVLRVMGVGKLKRTMNDTGVYFDPRDVVEKEDMVQIFVNSGRICLTEIEPESSDSGPDTTYGHTPCTRQQRSYSFHADDGNSEGDNNVTTSKSQKQPQRGNSVVVETVREDDEDTQIPSQSERSVNSAAETVEWESGMVMEETEFGRESPYETATPAELTWNDENGENDGVEATLEENPTMSTSTLQPVEDDDDPMDVGTPRASDSAGDAPLAAAAAADQDETETEWIDEPENNRKRERGVEDEQQPQNANSQYQILSITQLRALARERSVDLSHCIEKKEMIERISSDDNARQQQQQQQSNETRPGGGATAAESASLALAADRVQSWTMSQLRTCGNAVNLDMSGCSNPEDMIQFLLGAAEERPRLVKTILALHPIMTMSISQLRAKAREWNVNVADCLEKGEIVRRLSAAAAQRALLDS